MAPRCIRILNTLVLSDSYSTSVLTKLCVQQENGKVFRRFCRTGEGAQQLAAAGRGCGAPSPRSEDRRKTFPFSWDPGFVFAGSTLEPGSKVFAK